VAQLVLVVVASITGLVVYSEVAKVEKRFRRGPWGVPAFAWGFVGLICAALVGELLGAQVVVGALIGFVAFSETAKHEKQAGAAPLGIPPWAWAVGCGSLGLIGALVASTFPIWLVVGFVAYREASTYEAQYGKPVYRIPAPACGVAGFFFGLVGGLIVSAVAWTAVCAFLGLIAAYVLLLAERNALLTEKNAWVAAQNQKPTAPAAAPKAAPAPQPANTADQRDLLPHKR
jgi:hypothetical protein